MLASIAMEQGFRIERITKVYRMAEVDRRNQARAAPETPGG